MNAARTNTMMTAPGSRPDRNQPPEGYSHTDNPNGLHPAALEAASQFSQAMDENERLRRENAKLIEEINVLRKHNAFLERQVSGERDRKEVMQRYCTELATHISTIQNTVAMAQQAAVRAAERTPGSDALAKLHEETSEAVAAAGMANTGNPPTVERRAE